MGLLFRDQIREGDRLPSFGWNLRQTGEWVEGGGWSMDAFERGVKLVRALNHKLNEVERRVEVLMRGAGGDLEASPYEGENDAADGDRRAKKDDDIPF